MTSPELERAAGERPLSIYCGFDPTAESLHLGNLMGILVLSWFNRHVMYRPRCQPLAADRPTFVCLHVCRSRQHLYRNAGQQAATIDTRLL